MTDTPGSRRKWCEVVRIDSPIMLVSSRRQACRYETIDGKPLVTGHYVAMWPTRACHSYYGRGVRYFGPFATKAAALWLQLGALEFCVAECEVGGEDTANPLSSALNRRQLPPPCLDQVIPDVGPTGHGASELP